MKNTTLKRCRTEGSRILELPLHLIFDILSRLTIETIFSCKCVCKTFLETLTNPYFVELHLTRAPNTEDGLIIQDQINISNFLLVYDNRHGLGKPNSENCDYRPCQTMAMPAKASQFHNKWVFIVGSCNGLLCLCYSSEFPYPSYIYYICNPILGEFLPLPDHTRHDHTQYLISENVGFGFCPKTKLFKVLRFITPSICSIYTLGTDSWREIGEAPFPLTLHSFDYSLNGNLHWITRSTKMSNLICSFNLETEQFSYISPPVHFNKGAVAVMFHLKIGLLDGLFCLSYTLGDKFETFVMKDYGPEGCWTKKFSVDLNSSLCSKGLCEWNLVLGLLNNGELVLRCDNYTLICYDMRRGTTRHILPGKNERFFIVLSFVPSFISLKDMAGPVVRNVEVVQRKTRRNLLTENGFNFIR